jgi:hypothetical protein
VALLQLGQDPEDGETLPRLGEDRVELVLPVPVELQALLEPEPREP